MGRPPVRPEDRKRSAKACITCRATKKRCDGASPCRPCLNRGKETTCEYSQQRRTRRPARRPDTQPRHPTPTSLESRSEDPSSPLSQRHVVSTSYPRAQGASRRRALPAAQVPPGPRPVMMYTCSGERGTMLLKSPPIPTISIYRCQYSSEAPQQFHFCSSSEAASATFSARMVLPSARGPKACSKHRLPRQLRTLSRTIPMPKKS